MGDCKTCYYFDCYHSDVGFDSMINKERRFHKSVHKHMEDMDKDLTDKMLELSNTVNSHIIESEATIVSEINDSEKAIINKIDATETNILNNQRSMLSSIQKWIDSIK